MRLTWWAFDFSVKTFVVTGRAIASVYSTWVFFLMLLYTAAYFLINRFWYEQKANFCFLLFNELPLAKNR